MRFQIFQQFLTIKDPIIIRFQYYFAKYSKTHSLDGASITLVIQPVMFLYFLITVSF